jgi:hypothetical protein
MKWFKLHSEFSHDPKLATFSKAERCDLIDLLCLANESNQRGVIVLDNEDLAATLSLSIEEYEAFEDKLVRKGIVTRTDEGLSMSNWEKRQYEKPSATPERVAGRVAKHRESKRNANVTPSNAVDTDTDTDTDTEKNREENIAPVARDENATVVKPPDPLFNAIAEAWMGEPYRPDLLNEKQSPVVGAATAALRKVNAQPADVPGEWQRLNARFDNPSPIALAKHWGTNGSKPAKHRNGRPREPDFAGIDEWGQRMQELEQRQ